MLWSTCLTVLTEDARTQESSTYFGPANEKQGHKLNIVALLLNSGCYMWIINSLETNFTKTQLHDSHYSPNPKEKQTIISLIRLFLALLKLNIYVQSSNHNISIISTVVESNKIFFISK